MGGAVSEIITASCGHEVQRPPGAFKSLVEDIERRGLCPSCDAGKGWEGDAQAETTKTTKEVVYKVTVTNGLSLGISIGIGLLVVALFVAFIMWIVIGGLTTGVSTS